MSTNFKTIKVAVIGAGHFAYRVHIPVLASRPEVVLDSVCRLGAEELEIIRSEFGFAHATEQWRDILERDIDVALITSPHNLHYEQAKAFLEKGCHVLIEKPMCLDPAEAWNLVDTARQVQRDIVVSYGWHYKPGLSEARDMIAKIGRIEHVLCHMASFTRRVFAGGGGTSRWSHIRIQPEPQTWQNAENGGGFAYGQLSHAMGLLYWLTDLRAETMHAVTATTEQSVDLHDAAIATFDNGATGVFSGSCGIPDGHGFEVDIRVYGEHGSVSLDIENETLVLKLPGGVREEAVVPKGAWFYSCEGPAKALIDKALGHNVNTSPGEVGARAVETLHALMQSAREGGRQVPVYRQGDHT